MSGQNLAISGCRFCYFVFLWQIFHIHAEKTAPKVNALRAEIKLFEFDVNENLHMGIQRFCRSSATENVPILCNIQYNYLNIFYCKYKF